MTENRTNCTYETQANLVWEKIGTQIVLANLNSGKYCTIEHSSGPYIWENLLSNYTIKDLHDCFKKTYPDYNESNIQAVNQMVQQLIEMDFIKVSEQKASNSQTIVPPSQKTFVPPVVRVYDDLDSVLQLDPIDDDLDEYLKNS